MGPPDPTRLKTGPWLPVSDSESRMNAYEKETDLHTNSLGFSIPAAAAAAVVVGSTGRFAARTGSLVTSTGSGYEPTDARSKAHCAFR